MGPQNLTPVVIYFKPSLKGGNEYPSLNSSLSLSHTFTSIDVERLALIRPSFHTASQTNLLVGDSDHDFPPEAYVLTMRAHNAGAIGIHCWDVNDLEQKISIYYQVFQKIRLSKNSNDDLEFELKQ